jgi:hypothetical protein
MCFRLSGAIVKSLTLFLALTIALAGPPVLAQDTTRIRDENIPGKLESLLIATSKASLNKKVLGVLESSGKATFTGIVATNPNTDAKVKGLEIYLEEGDLKTVAYLDEECLKRVEKSLRSLIMSQQYIADNWKDYSHQELEEPSVTLAYNEVPGTDEHADKAGVTAIGFYGHEGGFGLYLGVFWGRLHHSGQFYFPKTSLSDLLQIIQGANTFLIAN